MDPSTAWQKLQVPICFHDWDYIEKTRNLISTERERIYNELKTWDSVKVYKTHANFILVRILKEGVTSYDVFVHCIKKGCAPGLAPLSPDWRTRPSSASAL